MTRRQFRIFWLLVIGVLLLVSIDVARVGRWLEPSALALVGGLMLWEVERGK